MVVVEARELGADLFIGGEGRFAGDTVRRDIFSSVPRILLPAHAFQTKSVGDSACLSSFSRGGVAAKVAPWPACVRVDGFHGG